MKIIEWNCQGAFRKKHDRILAMRPDIVVVSECESKEKLKFGELTPKPKDFYWYGESANKGIGIFSYSEYKIELLPCFNPKYRYVIPLNIKGKDKSFFLFAIWAMDNKENSTTSYIGQVWLAINYYKSLFSSPCVLTGDFNSNKIWDKKERVGDHSDMVEFLAKDEILSLYHLQHSIEQGEESEATFHLHRNLKKPYHIDYFFASKTIIENGFNLSIGHPKDWLDLSDHVPLILECNLPKKLLTHTSGTLGDILLEKL